jgi:outer membrane protein TolC
MKKISIVLLLLLWHGVALAEPPPPSAATETIPPRPKVPAVDDPMLAPPPPPRRVLSSWSEAVGELRALSTDLRIALDQVLTAEALTGAALAKYLPSLQGNGQYVHELLTRKSTTPVEVAVQNGLVLSTTAPIPNTLSGTLSLAQTLIGVQALDQIGISRHAEDAARLSADDKRRTIALGVADQIVAVVTAERSVEINRVGLREALELLELVRERQTLGGATIIDVVRAEQNAADARATLVSGDEALREAREALGLALGIPEEMGVAPGLNIDGVADEVLRTCKSVSSVDERPDLAAARVQLEVAKRNLRNVWFGFLPTLNGVSDLYATTSAPTGFPNPIWDIQGLLTVPIWDGGTQYANLKAARAAQDVAQQDLVALHRQSLVQVEQARRQLVVAGVSDKVAREQRDIAARNEALNQIAYVAGQATSLELVTASEAYRSAELNVAIRDFEIIKAKLLATLALATCTW